MVLASECLFEGCLQIAMMTLYCDESDDGQTYALAGWLAVPSAWETFDPAWRAMLQTIAMPDGAALSMVLGAGPTHRD